MDGPDVVAEFPWLQKTIGETDKSEGGKRNIDFDSEDKGEESNIRMESNQRVKHQNALPWI